VHGVCLLRAVNTCQESSRGHEKFAQRCSARAFCTWALLIRFLEADHPGRCLLGSRFLEEANNDLQYIVGYDGGICAMAASAESLQCRLELLQDRLRTAAYGSLPAVIHKVNVRWIPPKAGAIMAAILANIAWYE